MKLTNRLGLPQPIVSAVTNDPYTKGDADISITALIAPARQRVLRKKHEAELEEDVSERIYSLLGQVMHGVLERVSSSTGTLKDAYTKAIHEKRWYVTIDGVKVSGQLDAYYDNGLIQDYKLVSVYSIKGGVKPEYEEQQNCYAALLRLNGLLVTKLELVCILRDWSKMAAKRDPDMPQSQVVKLEVPLWSEDAAMAFLKDRIAVHKAANKKLPECTPEERWATPDKYAVMSKPGAARSLKNHEDKEDAEQHVTRIKESGEHPKAFVEDRPGVNTRCENYCNVSRFCKQYQSLKTKE